MTNPKAIALKIYSVIPNLFSILSVYKCVCFFNIKLIQVKQTVTDYQAMTG